MPTYIEPLDFRKIIIETLFGKEELFIFAFLISFSFVAAKMNMSNRIYLMLLAVGSIIFSVVLGEAVYMLVIFLVGIITFGGMKRMFT